MKFISVCSGIEAASVAWSPLGWEAAAVSEIEPFPCHVLHHRHGAGRPMHMPDPADVEERNPIKRIKEERRRAAAIKAVERLPEHDRIPNLGDMTKFQEWPDVPDVSLLVGGTPCQSFSVAGLRKGLGDPRGNLALTYLAIADRYRPQWVVWENVPGVLSSNGGRDFGAFLGGLGQLGYGFAYRVLDAQYVRTCSLPYAVPQRRRRVFVVGYLGDWRRAGAVLFDRASLRGDPAPRREAGKRAAPTLAARTRGGGGLGTDFDCDGGLIAEGVALRGREGGGTAELTGPVSPALRASQGGGDKPHVMAQAVAPTLNAHFGEKQGLEDQHINGGGGLFVAHALRGEGFDASEDGTGRGTPLVPHAVAIQERAVSENPDNGPQGAGFKQDGTAYTLEARHHVQAVAFDCKGSQVQTDEGISHPLRSMNHDGSHANAGGHAAVAFAENSRHELRLCGGDGSVMSQLTTGGGKPGQGQPTIATRWAVRRLTPLECERLQGFPDRFTDVPYGKRNTTPDGPRYKALGNSMAVNAMQWIGERIELVREIIKEHAA